VLKRIVFGIALLELVLGVSMLACCFPPAKADGLVGDVNGDGRVDGDDLLIVSRALGSYGPNFIYPGSPPHPRWNEAADIWGGCGDNQVNGHDLVLVAMNFGKGSS
jgi:hypothetical protein